MNILDYILLAIIIGLIILALIAIRKRKNTDHCSGCPYSSTCKKYSNCDKCDKKDKPK